MSEKTHSDFSFATKKLNDEKVGAVKFIEPVDNRPVKGASLFPEIYSNVFFCARKKSGKTWTLCTTVKKCSGKNTKVIVFCSTVNKDPCWAAIRLWCEKKDIPFVAHTSLKNDDGVDELNLLVQELSVADEEKPDRVASFLDDEEEEEEEEKPPKYRAPEYIIILDDLANELKSVSITSLLKKNRHFRAKILISSQHLNDLLPAGRRQLDYFILFRGHPLKKIAEIHRDADIHIPLEEFYQVYQFATKEPFSFLYVDCITGQFRRNFNTLIEV